MKLQTHKKELYLFVAVSNISFLVLSTLAMVFYPGGTALDRARTNYDFFMNFFSDTGQFIAYNGQPNYISMILFSIALILVSLSIIPFFSMYPAEYPLSQNYSYLKRRIKYVGTLTAGCFIGIALTPWDILPLCHVLFVAVGYSLTFYAIFLLYKIMLKSKISRPIEFLVTRGFLFLVGGYIGGIFLISILFYNQHELNLFLQVVAQKMVVYSQIFYFTYLSVNQISTLTQNRIKLDVLE